MPDPHDIFQALSGAQQQLLAGMMQPFKQGAGQLDASATLQQLAQDYARDPARWQQLQQSWYKQQMALWAKLSNPDEPQLNANADTAAVPDKRFRAPEWREPYFQWLSQSYLITSQWLASAASGAELTPHEKRKALFQVRQWIDAASPANFALSNPEALKLAAQTQGASLAQGLQNLRDDLPRGMVSMSDDSAFAVGRNLAVTPGAVVFENELLQLIQYRPTTATVHERPLLMVEGKAGEPHRATLGRRHHPRQSSRRRVPWPRRTWSEVSAFEASAPPCDPRACETVRYQPAFDADRSRPR